jgi:ABC-type multidrug transport system fused ATPase/permease subunit
MTFFRSLVEPLIAYRWRLLGELGINSLLACAPVLSVGIFQLILANIEHGVPYPENYPLLAGIAALVTIPGLIRLAFYHNEPLLFVRTNQYLTRKYLSRFVIMDNEEISRMGTGKLLAIMKGGIDIWTDALWQVYYHALPQLVAYFVALALIARIEPWLLLPAGIFTVWEGIFIWWTNNRTHRYRVLVRKFHDDLMRQWTRVIMEKFPILKYDRINSEVLVTERLWNHIFSTDGHKKGFYLSLLKVGTETILDLAKVVFFVAIGYFGWVSKLSVSEIAIVLVLANLLSRYGVRANEYYRGFTSASQKIRQTVEFYDSVPVMAEIDAGEEFVYRHGDVSLQHMAFSYAGQGREIFTDLSLDIAGSRRTALVGASGVGKSTLMKLILRFVAPTRGIIRVDGQDLSDVSLRSYFRTIGYLSQEPSLFDGTVRENLVCALPDGDEASQERLDSALRSAECDFVFALRDGLDTEIGEK